MTDSLSPEKLNPDQLSRKLLEKHRRMFDDYQREFEIRQKVSVLNEKGDLLEHWIKSAEEDGSNGYEKYKKDKEMVSRKISSLISELRDMALQDVKDESKDESRNRYSFLEERINAHKEAIDYWNDRVKELPKKKKTGKGKEKKQKIQRRERRRRDERKGA